MSVRSPTLAGVTEAAAVEQLGGARVDRVRLEALRYAVNDESASYIAIMRLFTGGLTGMLSDQSAAEVTARLREHGIDLDEDTVDARLSYLVEHGNLARSPRETEARSLQDYLRNVFETRKEKTMFIAGAGTLRYSDIIAVIDAAKGAGVEKVGIVTEKMRSGGTAKPTGN